MSLALPRPGRGPSQLLPLAYFTVAAAAFVPATFGIAWLAEPLAGHYYQPRLVALTHAVTLGWITLTIMGASYQLVPIVLQRPVWSERLARWQLAILVVGIAGMVGHFFLARSSGLLWAAALAGAGIVLYLVNLSLSLRGLPRWSHTARLLVVALAGLAGTLGAGLLLAADRVFKFLPWAFFPTLHVHVHLALLGWIAPVVFGVAARVFPMFLLTREPGGWLGHLQCWGLVAGVPLVVVGLAGAPPLVAAGAVLVAASAVGHVVWVVDMARAKKRPALDWGLRFALTGTGFLVAATALGLALAFGLLSGPRAALTYAVTALGGWISLTIVGMMLKIAPLLVWYRAYSSKAGREPVPTLAQLSSPQLEAAAYTLLAPGIGALVAAVALAEPLVIRVAGALVALGALAFAATLARVLCHLVPSTARSTGAAVGARAR